MREKHIKLVIEKKFNNWINSIEDDEIKEIARKSTVITGGAFTSLLQNERPNDYDIYFTTKRATLAIAKYYVQKFNNLQKEKRSNWVNAMIISEEEKFKAEEYINDREDAPISHKPFFDGVEQELKKIEGTDRIRIYIQSDGIAGEIPENTDRDFEIAKDIMGEKPLEEAEEDKNFRPVFLSSNAITLSDGIQLIVRFWGQPAEIHDTFDFIHTKAYWTSQERKINIPKEAYEAVMSKTLIYTGSKYPICSLFRIRKFIQRGWTINAGQILKISFQISKLDLENISVLEDQLVGVDSLYFSAIISQLQKKKEEDPNWEMNQKYIIKIIDKIF